MEWWQTLIVAIGSGAVGFVASALRDKQEWSRRRKDLADERTHAAEQADAQRAHELSMAAEESAAAERKARRREAGEVLAESVRAVRALFMHEGSAVAVYLGIVEKHGHDSVDIWVSFERDRNLEGEVAMATARAGLLVSDDLRQCARDVMNSFDFLRAHNYDPSTQYFPPQHRLSNLQQAVEYFEQEAAAEVRRLAEERPGGEGGATP